VSDDRPAEGIRLSDGNHPAGGGWATFVWVTQAAHAWHSTAEVGPQAGASGPESACARCLPWRWQLSFYPVLLR